MIDVEHRLIIAIQISFKCVFVNLKLVYIAIIMQCTLFEVKAALVQWLLIGHCGVHLRITRRMRSLNSTKRKKTFSDCLSCM